MIILKYQEVKEQSKEVLKALGELFKYPLSEELHILEQQAKDIEAWYSNVLYLLPQAEKYYRDKRNELMGDLNDHSQDKKATVSEKETYIDSHSSAERCLRDTLENMSEAVRQRISLAQSIIKKGSMEKRYE